MKRLGLFNVLNNQDAYISNDNYNVPLLVNILIIRKWSMLCLCLIGYFNSQKSFKVVSLWVHLDQFQSSVGHESVYHKHEVR